MRILPQDGLMFDIQYENCHLVVNEKCCEIEAETSNPNFTPVMASYSSVEKCKKAMEMLRRKYCEITIYPFSNKSSTIPPKVFRFPTDDELAEDEEEENG